MKFLPASLWSFLRWNLGDPKKLFFIVLNRFFQWAIEGEPGVVAADSEESAGTKVNWMKVQFPQHVSFSCPHFHSQRLRTDHQSKGALCVQMDFTWTFETTTKCNNINHVWSHFYNILVVLKYYRHTWANIDTDISRCIKVVFLASLGIFMLLQMSVSKILAHRHLWYFKTTKILWKMTSIMIYVDEFGVGLKFPYKIHLNTQWPCLAINW